MAASGPSGADAVAAAVEMLRRVPDQHRHFTVDAGALSRVHRIDPLLLARLLDLGLPHLGSGPERRFDTLDAENLGLTLALPSPRRLGMRWWRRAFADVHASRAFSTVIRISAPGPAGPGDQSGCSLDPRVWGAAVPGGVAETSSGVFMVEPRLDDVRHVFDDSCSGLGELADSIRFHLLPRSLQQDLGFLAETGLADCRLAALFLATEARGHGVRARKSEGLILGRPYASWHAWVEVDVAGRWIAMDPFFLRTLAGWGVIDGQAWPANRSPHPLLWRLDSGYLPLLWRDGVPLPPDAVTPAVFTAPR